MSSDREESDNSFSGKRRRQPLLERLRTRLDRYREIGRARRQRLEHRASAHGERATQELLGRGSQVVPGTARAILSGKDFDELENKIGYTIKHRAYFLQALTHRSYLQFVENPSLRSNERLEFLGDSILNLIIAEYLYGEFESLPEGELTKLRSRLVSGASLAEHAKDIALEKFLLLSTSAQAAVERGSATLLADAYEAVIAAIYLDGGMDAARNFVYRHIITHTRRDELMLSDRNYKSILLEFVQARKLSSPKYLTVREAGPNHARTFSVEVHVSGTKHGSGEGRSKKEAEQNAAREALEFLGVLPPSAENGITTLPTE